MADPKCAVHEERLQQIEHRLERMEDEQRNRLGRIEDDLESVVHENHQRATALAVAERSFALFQDIVTRLEARIETLEKRIEALLKDRWQVLVGLFGNAGLIGIVLWMVERKS